MSIPWRESVYQKTETPSPTVILSRRVSDECVDESSTEDRDQHQEAAGTATLAEAYALTFGYGRRGACAKNAAASNNADEFRTCDSVSTESDAESSRDETFQSVDGSEDGGVDAATNQVHFDISRFENHLSPQTPIGT
jgi:hypothetical protein